MEKWSVRFENEIDLRCKPFVLVWKERFTRTHAEMMKHESCTEWALRGYWCLWVVVACDWDDENNKFNANQTQHTLNSKNHFGVVACPCVWSLLLLLFRINIWIKKRVTCYILLTFPSLSSSVPAITANTLHSRGTWTCNRRLYCCLVVYYVFNRK